MSPAEPTQTPSDTLLDNTYQLRREIARTSRGIVYEAEHVVTRVRVAIKTLQLDDAELKTAQARLLREARILGALRHPNLVAVYDAGTCPTYGAYLVLELIEGRSLDGILLTRHKLPVGQTIALALQLCDALREVHKHEVVHRDIKPGNVLIAKTAQGDRVRLIDFGLAKLLGEQEAREAKITKVGDVLGPMEYMAPEQLMGHAPVDMRADVYGIAVLIFECLTGEVPYAGNATSLITKMLSGVKPAAIRARRDDVPLDLEIAIGRALEIDPKKRFASVAELAHACVSSLGGVLPSIELLDSSNDQEADPDVIEVAESAPKKQVPPPLPPPPLGVVKDEPHKRRQHVRAPYVTPVRVRSEKGETYDGRTEDLSEGGVLMITDSGGGDAEKVRLRLPLPVSGRVVEVEAVTKWIKSRRAQRAVGVEFVNPTEEMRAEIRSYVALMSGAAQRTPRVVP